MSDLRDEIVTALHRADAYLSLVGYRYRDGLPLDLPAKLIETSTTCRNLAKRIKEESK